jgi:hypothetical protein
MKSAMSPSSHCTFFEQRSRPWRDSSSGKQVADHVVAEGGVDRRPWVLERVVGIGLVPVDHPDPLGPCSVAMTRSQDECEVVDAEALSQYRDGLGVPGQLSVVVAGQDDHRDGPRRPAKRATASVNWGWASRILPTSGGPANISNPSPAMMNAAGPEH